MKFLPFIFALFICAPAFAADSYLGAECRIETKGKQFASDAVNIHDVITIEQASDPEFMGLDLLSVKKLTVPVLGGFVPKASSVLNFTKIVFQGGPSPSLVAVLQTNSSPGKANRKGKFKATLTITNSDFERTGVLGFAGNSLFYNLTCARPN